MSASRRVLVALLGAVVLGLAAPAGAPAVTPQNDPFYTPPSPLPAGQPGDIIRARPVTVYQLPLVTLEADAWQILYLSTDALGNRIAVSGTVLVPPRPYPSGPRPLVTFAAGTQGLGDQCAPSYQMTTGTEYETSQIARALGRDWAVVMTDYQGLGTPGDHTYVVGQTEGRSVLDAARAAQRLTDAGLQAEAPLAIWGYSQGGGAAAWAGELQPSYAPELKLKGVAAGGVPADLVEVAKSLDGGAFAGFEFAAASGFAAAYPDLPFDSILNAAGQRLLPRLRRECVQDIIVEGAFKRIEDFTTVPDPINLPEWRTRLNENKAGGQAPPVPVFLYHGQGDEVIPIAQARTLFEDYCRQGATARFQTIPVTEHLSGAFVGAPGAVTWIADRFAGEPAPSTCGPGPPPGTVVISELRGSGTVAEDDYLELFNRASTPVSVAGWRVRSRNADDVPVNSFILGAQQIPPRGTLLVGGRDYTLNALAQPDLLLPSGITFTTGSVALIDADGATQDSVRLSAGTSFGEGEPLGTFGVRGQYTFVRKPDLSGTGDAYGAPLDTGDNASDFSLVVPPGATSTPGSALPSIEGVPGPQSLASPRLAGTALRVGALDATQPLSGRPNRDVADPDGPGPTLPTLYLRRRVTNVSGGPLTSLRFRATVLSTARSDLPAGQAVIRLDSSDSTTVAGQPITPTRLERSPQTPLPDGGGLNAVVTVPSITPESALASGASINVEFALRNSRSGAYQAVLSPEAK